jgi:hypothetical protein
MAPRRDNKQWTDACPKVEGRQMATVIPDLSPADLLSRFRGTVLDAAPGYPEIIILRLRDGEGGAWEFSTAYAEYSPSDPDFFVAKSIVDATLQHSGELTMRFSDGSEFKVLPEPEGPDDELPTWRLFTPEGLVLRFRPRGRWDLVSADAPV